MKERENSVGLDKNLCQWMYRQRLHDILLDPTKIQNKKLSKLYVSTLSRLEFFIDELLSNDEIPFVLSLSGNGTKDYDPSSLAHSYFILVNDFIDAVNMLSQHYYYSERINVFIDCCYSMGLLDIDLEWNNIWYDPKKTDPRFDGISAADIFNKLVEKIRHEWKTNNIQAKVNARKKDSNNRYTEYCKYIDALFNNCARQIVLRIDLYYKKQYANNFTIADITNDLNHLFENKRCNSIFNYMNGYIAKLEFGVDKGLHYHVLFFFDGSERNIYSHIHFAEEIGKYWVDTITKGRGDYWNVNDNAAHYDSLGKRGIGVINWDETNLMKNLKYIVQYFCKVDQFIRPKFGSKVRLLRRGNPPKIPIKKMGKPRTRKKPVNL
jgi:hypothetical protein